MKRLSFCAVALFLLASGCARSSIHSAEQALRLVESNSPSIKDDLQLKGLKGALDANIKVLQRSNSKDLVFGPRVVSRQDYVSALKVLRSQLDQSEEAFYHNLKSNFQVYEVYGKKDWGEAYVTSYFTPVIEGSLKAKGRFQQPLYRTPQDLVTVDLKAFADSFPPLEPLYEGVKREKTSQGLLRGRLLGDFEKGTPRVVPYFSRQEIDEGGALRGRKLEIVWVDPVDAFFLQIQGSGRVRLPSGEEWALHYGAQNGHKYVPIGRHLLEVIPLEEMSMQKIEEHLRGLEPQEQRELLNLNPSYVFFRKEVGPPLTSMGVAVSPGRTVATDTRFFPKGTLALLEFEKPQFASYDDLEPYGWSTATRLVLDQDTGGAIRGPHRVDLYWGKGDEAKQSAGVVKHWGRLFYLVPTPQFLSELSSSTLGK